MKKIHLIPALWGVHTCVCPCDELTHNCHARIGAACGRRILSSDTRAKINIDGASVEIGSEIDKVSLVRSFHQREV